MSFIHDDFLLGNPAARRLFHDYAKSEPIFDFHSHLPPEAIAANRKFNNLFEIWLEGDHYKWRAMRTNGVAERFCTGDATPFEKFEAWAATAPNTLRNPLFHWTHLELKRLFGVDELLNPQSAKRIWDLAQSKLATDELSVHGILKKFKVAALSTTDDPAFDLPHHRAILKSGLNVKVLPTYRPDKSFFVHQPEIWNAWVSQLEKTANVSISRYSDLLDALRRRHDAFHDLGCRLSDHGLSHCYADFVPEAQLEAIFAKARKGVAATPQEMEQFAAALMVFFGHLDAKRNWTKQLHLGPLRNNNTRQFKAIGPDTGFDSIGDWPQAESLSAYLNRLDSEGALPKTIIYNLNPADNYVIGTMLGNFQDGVTAGKIQMGSGWWFLDQKEGMEWQLNTLSNLGMLSRFVGMLTDSRSFASFPRHEYFRRVLCNLLGRDMENGELPNDFEMVGGMVKNICFSNANRQLAGA